MLKDFKQFIMRGNAVDLAVAVVIGAAFNNVVQAIVRDLITPLIAAIGGQPDFAKLTFTLNGSKFLYGDVINFVISFLLIAAVIFFLIVQPINKLQERAKRNKTTADPTTKKCPHCYSEVNSKATRCAFCTSKLSA
ncbi:MAG TPA: large conductance mechanosensitive channel protein MscL [Candidatus Saccharimonadales bacterium]|nr:large conductance mechanosensitive channel protein MscL [Candidatus Saccharimonadales bacterium]